MVWFGKSFSGGGDACQVGYTPRTTAPKVIPAPRRRHEGSLVGLVKEGATENLERLLGITDEVLELGIHNGRVLIKVPANDAGIDQYVGLPFTKGATERETGRTLLIAGSNAHHIDAMQNQYPGVLWSQSDEQEIKKYGNTIRWISAGNLKNGFIGVEYNPAAQAGNGVATTMQDIQYLANVLLQFGFDPAKRLFLLKPPFINELPEGKALRQQGFEKLIDYASKRLRQ